MYVCLCHRYPAGKNGSVLVTDSNGIVRNYSVINILKHVTLPCLIRQNKINTTKLPAISIYFHSLSFIFYSNEKFKKCTVFLILI